MNVCWNNVKWLNDVFYNQERPRVVAGFRIRIGWLGYILWGELLKQKFVHVDDIQLEKKEKSTYLFKHELLFKGLVFVAIFTLRLNLGACNGVLHTKSSPSENLTIKFGSYIKSADWKNLTIKIGSYIKGADWKNLTIKIGSDIKSAD